MGEAIITRAGGGSGGSGGGSSGELSPDPSLCKILVTLKNPDGSAVDNGKIKYVDSTNKVSVYSTNAKGKCLVTTNQASGYLYNDEELIDINSQNISLSTPLGEVINQNMNRVLQTSDFQYDITANKNVKFSSLINNVTAHIVGGGGGAGSGGAYARYTINTASGRTWQNECYVTGEYVGGNGYNNSKLISIDSTKEYRAIIGAGGSGGSNSDSRSGTASTMLYGRCHAQCGGTIGGSGGTTSFGGVISAVGGTGSDGSSNGTGASTPYISAGAAGASSWASGHCTATQDWTCTVSVRSAGGQAGKIILNNFQYK